MRDQSDDLLLGSLAAVMVVVFLLTFGYVLMHASQPPLVVMSELLTDQSRQNTFAPIADEVRPHRPAASASEPATTGQGGAR
jgi:hypothetical protein